MITNLSQYLKQRSKQIPHKEAFSDEKESFSFCEMDILAENIAFNIRKSMNDKINNPIIVFLDKSARTVAGFMGILYSGNYYVSLDVKMPHARLKKILSILNAEAAITSLSLAEKLNDVGFLGALLYLEDLSDEKKCKDIDTHLKGVIDTDPAYILFTSGSTGMPKGVVVSHRAVIDYIEWQCKTFDFDQSFVLGNQAPFYFDASMPDIFTPICSGSSMKIIPERYFSIPNQLIDYVNRNGINALIWVPSALMMLTSKDFFSVRKMENLKLVMFCGEVMPNKHLNLWRDAYKSTIFVNLYGPTEAAYACTFYIVERKFQDNESLPIGNACENTKLLILGKSDRPVSQGEVGELCIGGGCLALGYYNSPEKTQQSFIQNPLNQAYKETLYRTGDLVKYNSYGELEFVGRKDFQIKHMGYRIELGEVESAAYSIPQIMQCCVIYDDIDKKIVMYCTANETITEKTIFSKLKEWLPRYMLPGIIKVVNHLPLNANGKIDRNLLMRKSGSGDACIEKMANSDS